MAGTRAAPPASPDRDESSVLGLVARACHGDEAAWQAAWRWIDPRLSALVAQPRFLGRLSRHEDDQRAVVLAVMEKLREQCFRRLKLFHEAHNADRRLSFMAWLSVVAKRAGIDHLRAHPEYLDLRRRRDGVAGAWVDVQALPPETRLPGQRPPVTAAGTARELLEYARRVLPVEQQRALALWSAGESALEIARALGLPSVLDAERMVRAALERLRRKFRTSGGRVPP
jgi:DNA-directed RNA polymerase specialized sigma24 family protein